MVKQTSHNLTLKYRQVMRKGKISKHISSPPPPPKKKPKKQCLIIKTFLKKYLALVPSRLIDELNMYCKDGNGQNKIRIIDIGA